MRLRRGPDIIILRVDGIISESTALSGGRSSIIGSLKAVESARPKALILRINCPGGSVAACQEIYDYLNKIKGQGIPIIASMGDVAASGGVYIAMAATEVFANPGTVTGSIGAIIKGNDLTGLYEKVGVATKVIKSGEFKDSLSTYRPMSSAEQLLLQAVIDDSHSQFVEVVVNGRKKPKEEIMAIADGRIMTGRQALNLGLVDHLGGLEAAIDRTAAMVGLKRKPRVAHIRPSKPLWQRIIPFARLGLPAATVPSGIPVWVMPI